MELSPRLYNWLVRPKWFPFVHANDTIESRFDFKNKMLLDFGCGVGSSSSMFDPEYYLGVDCNLERILYAKCQYPAYNFRVLRSHHIPVQNNSIDYILIVSVLHHIPTEELPAYLEEFHRIIKPNGRILVIEPCIFESCYYSNAFMKFADRGKFIRDEDGYIKIFHEHHYKVEVIDRYKQLYLYNKLFFSAIPR